ncbi:MAG: urease accessory protein UreD, partial [Pseudomonadota bacterium]|nr:urease accessory protein UreD [Pseudomonadota bacterium]
MISIPNQPAIETGPRDVPGGWAASLDLGFRVQAGRTVLHRRRHRGPLLVQRPFYSPGGTSCQVCLLHPPGGLVGGDRLRIHADLSPGARALLTGPAATKVYRGGNGVSSGLAMPHILAGGIPA